jgi:hypothetical protein
MIVSELLTNTVVHGVGAIRLRLDTDAEVVRGEVVDEGPGFEVEVRERGVEEVGGRGLCRVVGVERGGAPRVEVVRGPLKPLGVAADEDESALSRRARRPVSSPIPALPPIRTTVWPIPERMPSLAKSLGAGPAGADEGLARARRLRAGSRVITHMHPLTHRSKEPPNAALPHSRPHRHRLGRRFRDGVRFPHLRRGSPAGPLSADRRDRLGARRADPTRFSSPAAAR